MMGPFKRDQFMRLFLPTSRLSGLQKLYGYPVIVPGKVIMLDDMGSQLPTLGTPAVSVSCCD